MDNTATIQKMKNDLATFRASKMGGQPVTQATSVAPTVSGIGADLANYRQSKATSDPLATSTASQENGGGFGGFVKGVVTAPATIIARPIQAAAVGGARLFGGAEAQDRTVAALDKFSQEKLGGVVAPIPQSASDVVKDVGRGVQTVALGTGAPIAGGAAFGLGSAIEQQGTDAFTSPEGLINTATQTAVGAGAGKLLGLLGKPLLNAAGKVIGTITPKILQDVAAQGTGAVTRFMAQHEIVPASVRPAINSIPKAAEAFDASVGKIFTGTKNAVKGAVSSQYPNFKSNAAKRYENIETDRLIEPAKTPGSTYKKAAETLKDAERRGIDLKKVAANNKVYAEDHISEGKYVTQEAADALNNEAMNGGKEILRPALAEAEPGVARIPTYKIREKMIREVSKSSDASLSTEQKKKFVKNIIKEYGDDSVTAARYRDGYSLTNLYDSKLQTSSGLYKSPKGGGVQTISDSLTSKQKKIESKVFADLLKENAPKELGLDKYFKAQEEKFILADYLESLNGKKAIQSLFQRAVRKTAQLAGATTGANVAGPFGMFSGYQFGGIVADTFASASNPVKVAFLKSIGKSEPEIYQIMREFTTDAKIARELRKALPENKTIFSGPKYVPDTSGVDSSKAAEMSRHYEGVRRRNTKLLPEKSSFREFYASPGGKTSKNLQDVVDITAVEKGGAKPPRGGRSQRMKLKEILDRNEEYVPHGKLPVKDVGKKPKPSAKTKRLNDIYGKLPTIR